MSEENEKFYREKTWQLIVDEIADVKREQRKQGEMLEQLNGRMKYIFGFAAAISVIFGFVWQWIVAKLTSHAT